MISVIIPALNEQAQIGDVISEVKKRDSEKLVSEIIVVDGGSSDETRAIAEKASAKVISSRKGRAVQMNTGALIAKGKILYFLHADSIPPVNFSTYVKNKWMEGKKSGCFHLSFDEDNLLMRFYCWFTKFDVQTFRFGDQSLFVDANLFREISGFKEELMVMEDNEIIKRLKQKSEFVIISEKVITSARKYRKNGFVRLQMIFTLIYLLYHLGVGQQALVALYRKLIKT